MVGMVVVVVWRGWWGVVSWWGWLGVRRGDEGG